MPEQLVSTTDSLTYDNLFAGGVMPVVADSVTLKAGQAYVRGTVLGYIDAEEKATIVDSSKTDGTQRPFAILADDVDATSEDVKASVYLTGEFNQEVLTFGGTDTVSKHKRVLRELGIFLKTTVNA